MVQQVNKKKLICIVGPTASGKTDLAMALAKELSGEVVSCDSVQVYKGLDIGSAKPEAWQRREIRHHMINIVSPEVSFSTADYVRLAQDCIDDIYRRGRLPVIAGGTGLYLNSLLDPPGFSPVGADEGLRRALGLRAQNGEDMHALLQKVDPESASRLHKNDLKRIIRALEVFELTGRPLSEFHGKPAEGEYSPLIIGLDSSDRELLYSRINRRVDIMVEQGLLEEVEGLYKKGLFGKTSRKAIGYNQLIFYLEGKCTLGEAIELIKRDTRRYAKRQLTWFRRDKRIKWLMIDRAPFQEIVENSLKFAKVFMRSMP